MTVSNPVIESHERYVQVYLDEASLYLSQKGKPMLPVVTRVFTLPLASKLCDIEVHFSPVNSIRVTKKVQPAPTPLPLLAHLQRSFKQGEEIEEYENIEWYPSCESRYHVGAGITDGEHVLMVVVQCFPVRYHPKTDTILYSNHIEIRIQYEEPIIPMVSPDEYDMVIIAPQKFITLLQPLVFHKNNHGIKTTIKSTESIYRESRLGKYDAHGRDKPEKIKYFIKYALDHWGITYVLLIGGRNHQGLRWHVPVRYSNLHDRDFWNDSYVSDLYYADIYRYNKTIQTYEFEDWDSNGNNIFAEWTWKWDPKRGWWYELDTKDILDLYPDVYVGRLPCRNIYDVRTIVRKIIKYEKNTYGCPWFKSMVLIGGDTVPFDNEYFEGEIATDFAASFVEPLGFNITRLWVSNGKLTGSTDVIKEISQGAGFLFFDGHGSPIVWSTHPQGDPDTWIDGLYTFEMRRLRNKNKLPVCIVGGCHNSQFDVTLFNMILGVRTNGLRYFLWDVGIDCFAKYAWFPRCWSWNLIRQRNGGSIATISNTGLGWTIGGPNCINYLDGYITTHFFQVYANLSKQGKDTLGMTHGKTITNYITRFSPNEDEQDRKTVEQWTLLGDPSLKIGGYP
jgi:hypothetical protein